MSAPDRVLAVFVRAAGDAPAVPGREAARELAERELSKPSYDRDTSLTTRIIRWIVERIERLLDAAAGTLSSGVGIAALVALVGALAVVVVLWTGPMARSASRSAGPVLEPGARTAAEYRAAADDAAARADWDTAVVERFRATVATLEERGVLTPESGRTADEVARDAAAVLAGVSAQLRAGATVFDSVRYGGTAARRDDDDALRRLDSAVLAARPQQADDAGGPVLSAPR
ncbi:uncharacterized protein DUF4129 [Haloactinopolyspora alba]|uniref:Uncharacterized protein DUF4129 n=1 Tax=Haloactinopolyspora alba TaxID=648780 RepID=A0A2P8DL34_9ACTN|nr:DUF4129 domain-containing protein [Haloactinopolyspora alba]PSK97908.1 uncharacterized protein DUF4129 [Haloactinopolyspora alba]